MAALAQRNEGTDHAGSEALPIPPVADLQRRGDPLNVTIENLTKAFEDTAALHGVSLAIEGGELIALLGPSGSGKTTLLRIIAGLDFPTAGRILFGNEDALGKTVQERNVGFVFQHYALFRHMTVLENIAFGLRVRPRAARPDEAAIRRRVADLLDLVQLGGLDKRYPVQLSGGQQQRVALARALAVDPRVLLLDEPFGALDAKVRKDLRRWLRDLHDRTGHTTVFVTHDQEEALELADRVAILNAGRLEQIGTADDVHDRPASPFVMSFVGDTSSLAIEVRDGQLTFAGQPFSAKVDGSADGAARLYLRPDDVLLTDPDRGELTGVVTQTRRTATGRRVQLKLGAQGTIESETPAAKVIRIGEQVGVRILRGHLFKAPPP